MASGYGCVDRGRIVGRDAAGKPTRMVGALKDITMQLAAERALHDAKDAAEATSRAKSAFLATISHEMRTPLNAVIGTATLLEHSTLTDDQRELLRLLKRSGDSLLTVVNDVLDFTKIEAGRIELDERPFDLQQTVRDSVSLVEHVARQKELRLETSFARDSAGWLHGDDTRLRQILLNLLSNAVKFTERGGVACRGHRGTGATAEAVDAADRRERYRNRHSSRPTGAALPPVLAGRLVDDTPLRRDGSRAWRLAGGLPS